MTCTNLKDVRSAVAARREFKGNSIYAQWEEDAYVVYSYGPHWPLAIYIPHLELWFVNTDKYSSTTSRHLSSLRLSDYVACDKAQMGYIKRTMLRLDAIERRFVGDDLRDAAWVGQLLDKVYKARPEAQL
jgi:hypothetical protein